MEREPTAGPVGEVRTSAAERSLVAAYNSFGFKLFGEILKAGPGGNIFVSPASAATVLTALHAGAEGETREAMASVLGLAGLDQETINRAYALLHEHLKEPDPKVQLNVANSLWAHQGLTCAPEFMEHSRKFFHSEVLTLDFGDPGSPEIINRWAATNTEGKVTSIVGPLDPDMVLLLLNALYFRGRWREEFDKARTSEKPFSPLEGPEKMVPMMVQGGEYPYYRGPGFQATTLAFGKGRVGFYIFLPDKDKGLGALLKELTQANWERWMSSFRRVPGHIQLPRFQLEYEGEFTDLLQTLGMAVAFDRQRANFAGARQEGDLFINRVAQKAVVEVNEEGAEAAATSMVSLALEEEPHECFTLIVDHPFLFALRDNWTGLVLFLGILNDPE